MKVSGRFKTHTIHTHTYTHTYTHTHTHTHTSIHTYIYIYTHTPHTHTHTHTHTLKHTHTHTHTHTHIHIHTQTHTHTHSDTHIHTQREKLPITIFLMNSLCLTHFDISIYFRLGHGDTAGENQFCKMNSHYWYSPTDFNLRLGSHNQNIIYWIIHPSK